jgi:zinc/manganese transport system permease protein
LDAIWRQVDILFPALIAGLLIVASHVPLGQEVLRRGIIFLDLAIAQIAGFGLIAASTIGVGEHTSITYQLVAMSTAIIASLLLYCLRNLAAEEQEALIGISFILAATGSILLLASNPHGVERLKDLLVGQILWVNAEQLLWVAVVYLLVLVVWFGFRDRIGNWAFYPLFAITVTVSTQLVGVYLVFASLIIPALVVKRFSGREALLRGYTMDAVGYILGLIISAWIDLPSGATITWSLAMVGLIVFFISFLQGVMRTPENGIDK